MVLSVMFPMPILVTLIFLETDGVHMAISRCDRRDSTCYVPHVSPLLSDLLLFPAIERFQAVLQIFDFSSVLRC